MLFDNTPNNNSPLIYTVPEMHAHVKKAAYETEVSSGLNASATLLSLLHMHIYWGFLDA